VLLVVVVVRLMQLLLEHKLEMHQWEVEQLVLTALLMMVAQDLVGHLLLVELIILMVGHLMVLVLLVF
jgi:hypothetical protein